MTNKTCKSCSSSWIPLSLSWAPVCTGSSAAVSTALLCWRSVLLLLLLSIPLHSFGSVQLGSAELSSTGLHSFGQVGAVPSCSFPHGSVCTRAVSSALQSVYIFTAFLSTLLATAWGCVNVTNTLMYSLLFCIIARSRGKDSLFSE